MAKPTYASVTETACRCGTVERLAREPGGPLVFKEDLNEFQLIYKVSSGVTINTIIYHCIFCGGALPQSRRSELFHCIDDAEHDRLVRYIGPLRSIEDAMTILGVPDTDDQIPEGAFDTGVAGASTRVPQRILTYTRLSAVADVQVSVDSNGEVQVAFVPKLRDSRRS
jgi:hypothetical protein